MLFSVEGWASNAMRWLSGESSAAPAKLSSAAPAKLAMQEEAATILAMAQVLIAFPAKQTAAMKRGEAAHRPVPMGPHRRLTSRVKTGNTPRTLDQISCPRVPHAIPGPTL